MTISIVIPCFNEERRLEPGLSRALAYLTTAISAPCEVVFVDDGSTDRTVELLQRAREQFGHVRVEVVRYPHNRGKGYAVRRGVLQATGDIIIVMDADFSVDLREVDRFLEQLSTYDVVIGTKKHLLTETLKHQKIPRRILGKAFTLLTNLMLGLRFTDITCGFKAFRTPAAQHVFQVQKIHRWAYDAETLFLARRFGYKVLELPVRWHHVEGSKVSPGVDTVRSFADLIRILSSYYCGRYRITALPASSTHEAPDVIGARQ